MRLDPVVLAVPMYFVLMGGEALIDRVRRAGFYTLNDTLTNLACGIYQQVLVAVLAGLLAAPYLWVYTHLRVSDWFAAHAGAAWVFAFVASDFFYYWFHRWSHESALGWFSHVVHHQSEAYNLSVALRQDAWQPLFSLWFQLPVALAGVPPEVFLSAYGVVIVYQFWIHTQLIDRLGPLEWVLNTPSHHRVHHGVDPRYLDKNYAGVFIVWDRLFGTFEPEGHPPTYGTIEPLRSFNPVWAHFQYGAKLLARVQATKGFWNKLQLLFRSPGWRAPDEPHDDLMCAAEARVGAVPYDVATPRSLRTYAVVSFVLALLTSLVAVGPSPQLSHGVRGLLAVMAVWALANVGGLIESRWWAPPSQYAFLAVVALAAVGLTVFVSPVGLVAVFVVVAMVLGLRAATGCVNCGVVRPRREHR
jgi:sterol desaturase/sphingolipid hydroxylase (fatty acid hydroxylase superfamily)